MKIDSYQLQSTRSRYAARSLPLKHTHAPGFRPTDVIDMSFVDCSRDILRSAAYMSNNRACAGAGLLIGPHLLLSTHHNIPDRQSASLLRVQLSCDVATSRNHTPKSFALDPARLFITDRDLDYTIVALSRQGMDTAWDQRSCGRLSANPDLTAGRALQVIHLSETDFHQEVEIRRSQLIEAFDGFLSYRAFATPPLPGSAIFDDKWEVVGIHHSGVIAFDAQGRILGSNGRPWADGMSEGSVQWIVQEGIRISSIAENARVRATRDEREFLDEAFESATSVSGGERYGGDHAPSSASDFPDDLRDIFWGLNNPYRS